MMVGGARFPHGQHRPVPVHQPGFGTCIDPPIPHMCWDSRTRHNPGPLPFHPRSLDSQQVPSFSLFLLITQASESP